MRPSHKELCTYFEELILRLIISDDSELNRRLDRIEHNIQTIMADTKALDAAIVAAFADIQADFAAQLAAIDAAVQTIIDKIAAGGTTVDLQPEIDAINAASATAKANMDTVAGQLPTTPTPPPTP